MSNIPLPKLQSKLTSAKLKLIFGIIFLILAIAADVLAVIMLFEIEPIICILSFLLSLVFWTVALPLFIVGLVSTIKYSKLIKLYNETGNSELVNTLDAVIPDAPVPVPPIAPIVPPAAPIVPPVAPTAAAPQTPPKAAPQTPPEAPQGAPVVTPVPPIVPPVPPIVPPVPPIVPPVPPVAPVVPPMAPPAAAPQTPPKAPQGAPMNQAPQGAPVYQAPYGAPAQRPMGFVDIDWRKYQPLDAGVSYNANKKYKFSRFDGFVGSVPQTFVNRTFPKCPLCCSDDPYWTIAQHNQMSWKGNLYLFKCSRCEGIISMSMPDVTTLGNGGAGVAHNPSVGLTNLMVKASSGKQAGAVYAVIESVGHSGVTPECQGKEFKLEDVQKMFLRM